LPDRHDAGPDSIAALMVVVLVVANRHHGVNCASRVAGAAANRVVNEESCHADTRLVA
jgi:hypothetical protein